MKTAKQSREAIASVEGEAKQLRCELQSAHGEKARAILRRLKTLAGKLPPTSRTARRALGIIASVMAQAQQQCDEDEDDYPLRTSEEKEAAREKLVYLHMSVHAKAFYDAIDTEAEYTVAEKKIEGKTLRRAFSVLEYHKLDEDKKQDIRSKTGDAHTPEIVDPELAALEEALYHMEAYKLVVVMAQSSGDMAGAWAKIRGNHRIFMEAHRKIREVRHQEAVRGPLALAAADYAKQQLKTLLQAEVIDRVLLERTPASFFINGGMTVAEIQPLFSVWDNAWQHSHAPPISSSTG